MDRRFFVFVADGKLQKKHSRLSKADPSAHFSDVSTSVGC